jgi:CBS domain-containing protein
VNVVIAAFLLVFVGVTMGFLDVAAVERVGVGLPAKLLVVNILLILFNMVPAFPMDGGRVLRAILAMRMNYARATQIAASIGQAVAFGFAFYGLIKSQPMLILIGIFIYFGAANEAAFAQMKYVSRGLRVSAAMVTQFQTLPLSSTLNAAVEALLRTSQHEFPVVDEKGTVCGVLTRDDLIVGLRRSGAQAPVAEVMRVDIPSIHHSMLFDRAYQLMQECGSPVLPVLDNDGQLVGLFTPENVGELMLVQSALAKASRNAPRDSALPPRIAQADRGSVR